MGFHSSTVAYPWLLRRHLCPTTHYAEETSSVTPLIEASLCVIDHDSY